MVTVQSPPALQTVFNPFPELTTSRLALRQVADTDVPQIFFLRSDPRMMRHIHKAPAASHEDAAKFIEMIDDLARQESAITWGLSLKDDPSLIGTVCLWRIEKLHYRAELGYGLHPDYQGKGLMSEAVTAVLDYGFRQMGLHSVEAHVNPENESSWRLLERAGFVREGCFREKYYYNGRFYDSAVYSLFATE